MALASSEFCKVCQKDTEHYWTGAGPHDGKEIWRCSHNYKCLTCGKKHWRRAGPASKCEEQEPSKDGN